MVVVGFLDGDVGTCFRVLDLLDLLLATCPNFEEEEEGERGEPTSFQKIHQPSKANKAVKPRPKERRSKSLKSCDIIDHIFFELNKTLVGESSFN